MSVDKPARFTIVIDCQIRCKKIDSETVTLSNRVFPQDMGVVATSSADHGQRAGPEVSFPN